jgi:hypothetical protein
MISQRLVLVQVVLQVFLLIQHIDIDIISRFCLYDNLRFSTFYTMQCNSICSQTQKDNFLKWDDVVKFPQLYVDFDASYEGASECGCALWSHWYYPGDLYKFKGERDISSL